MSAGKRGTGILPVSVRRNMGGTPMPRSAWPKVRLDECTEIVAGATPSTSVEAYWGGDVCWATPKDLSDLDGSYISDTPRKLTRAGLQNCAASILPAGSVLFSSRAPIGHVAVNTVPMATNQGFKSFVPKPGRALWHAATPGFPGGAMSVAWASRPCGRTSWAGCPCHYATLQHRAFRGEL